MQKGENLCAPNLADNPGSRVQKDILLGGSSTFVLDLTHSGLLSLLTTLVNLAGMGMGMRMGMWAWRSVCGRLFGGAFLFFMGSPPPPLAMKAFPHPAAGLPRLPRLPNGKAKAKEQHGVHFNFCFVYNLRDTTSIKCLAGKAHTCS